MAMTQPPRQQPDADGPAGAATAYAAPRSDHDWPALEQVLTFRLAGERYGIAIGAIVEILKYRQATPVPRAEPVVHGIISLRGRIVTVIDGRRRLGLAPAEIGPTSRIVVVRDQGEPVGILVDQVLQVLKLPADAIKPPPATVAAAENGILGVCDTRQDSILILLDTEQFLRT
jgi:purine-binding chemotaxis protein CheW